MREKTFTFAEANHAHLAPHATLARYDIGRAAVTLHTTTPVPRDVHRKRGLPACRPSGRGCAIITIRCTGALTHGLDDKPAIEHDAWCVCTNTLDQGASPRSLPAAPTTRRRLGATSGCRRPTVRFSVPSPYRPMRHDGPTMVG